MSVASPALDCFGCCGALPRLACPLPFVSLASLFSNWSGFSLSSAAIRYCCILAWPFSESFLGPIVLSLAEFCYCWEISCFSCAAFAGWLQGPGLAQWQSNKCHLQNSSIYEPKMDRQLTCSPDNSRAGLPLLHRSSIMKLWL